MSPIKEKRTEPPPSSMSKWAWTAEDLRKHPTCEEAQKESLNPGWDRKSPPLTPGQEIPGEAAWAVRSLRTLEGWCGNAALMEVIVAELQPTLHPHSCLSELSGSKPYTQIRQRQRVTCTRHEHKSRPLQVSDTPGALPLRSAHRLRFWGSRCGRKNPLSASSQGQVGGRPERKGKPRRTFS